MIRFSQPNVARLASVLILMFLVISSQSQASFFVPLGDLSGATFSSNANAVSADGLTVVGRGLSANNEAFRWMAAGGMVGLGFPTGKQASKAVAVSADGTVVVGQGTIFGGEAFRWESGVMTSLGFLGGASSFAFGVSGDGSVVVAQ